MPRAARKKSESGIYHVMLRGINRQVVFEDDEDCEKYLQCLADCKPISGFTLYAYCLMGNHLHLLLQEGKEPLEQIFKRIGARYVFWYNWKYKRSGHLFQDRFKSEPVDEDSYFLAVLRYIYQNPVKAGLCVAPEEYRWSSYQLVVGRQEGGSSVSRQDKPSPLPASCPPGLVSHDKVLGFLPAEQLRAYINQPAQETFLDVREDSRVTDKEAVQMLRDWFQVENIAAFQRLPRDTQAQAVQKLRENHCVIRQIVRITGISKGVVERVLKG